MIKGVTHSHLGLILYHSEPSNVPYFPNQQLVMNFFCRFLQQTGSDSLFFESLGTSSKETVLGHTFLFWVLTPTATHGLLNFFHFACVCNMV